MRALLHLLPVHTRMIKTAASLARFLILAAFCTDASAHAYFVRSGPFANTGVIAITGEITEQDAAFIEANSTSFSYKRPSVFLNSRGGDVYAAMKIGRMIRAADATTWIRSRCYSSCALIFIAGVERWNLGELGLHRPYLASAPLSRTAIEREVSSMRSAVKTYVQEMGITDAFFERMFNTDPSRIETYRENWESIVPDKDPVFDEVLTSLFAQKYGVTTSEYRRRDLMARSCITSQGDLKYPDCPESIRWGLVPDVYRSRAALARTKCGDGFSDSEKKLLDATPTKDRNALPFVARYNACQLNAMSGK